MAKNMVVTITDDIDGSDGAETVSFSFDGQAYEIDLGPKNQEKFRKGLRPFIDAGRRISRRDVPQPRRSRAVRQNSGAIRTWAAEQGLDVNARGRIPASIVEKYEANH